MTNLPTDPESLTTNAEYMVLQIGTNPDQYTVLQDLVFNLEHPEVTEVATGTTASPALIRIPFYGAGDNWIEFTLLLSLTEFISFATTYFNRDSHGQVPLEYFKIKITDKSGTTKTIGNTANTPTGFKGRVVFAKTSKPVMGAVKYRVRVRLLEDSITIT